MCKKASLHWRDRATGAPAGMTPYYDLALAEADLADARARGQDAWLEFAHFPRVVDATELGCHAAAGWRAVTTGKRTAAIQRHGQTVAEARRVANEPRTEPYWAAEMDGQTHTAGCTGGLVRALRAAAGPTATA